MATGLNRASSEADAASESAVTCLTIKSPRFPFLVLNSKSNSDTRTKSFSQQREQHLNSSQVHLLCLPTKLLLLFTQGEKNKNSTFSTKNGKWLVFNPLQEQLISKHNRVTATSMCKLFILNFSAQGTLGT